MSDMQIQHLEWLKDKVNDPQYSIEQCMRMLIDAIIEHAKNTEIEDRDGI
jgi:hypothetical protein